MSALRVLMIRSRPGSPSAAIRLPPTNYADRPKPLADAQSMMLVCGREQCGLGHAQVQTKPWSICRRRTRNAPPVMQCSYHTPAVRASTKRSRPSTPWSQNPVHRSQPLQRTPPARARAHRVSSQVAIQAEFDGRRRAGWRISSLFIARDGDVSGGSYLLEGCARRVAERVPRRSQCRGI